MTNYQYWDLKYYYKIHCDRQQQLGNTPTAYISFTQRLKKMNLHDAIYTPRVEYQVRDHTEKAPIQARLRRIETLRQANIPIISIPEKSSKPWLLDRFISIFR